MKRAVVLILGITFLISCSNEHPVQKPDLLMDESLYLDLFYELELLRVYQNRGTGSAVIDSLHEEIFKKYKADKEFFLESHQFYQSQIDKQQIRVDTVIARIEKELLPLVKLDSLKTQEENDKVY